MKSLLSRIDWWHVLGLFAILAPWLIIFLVYLLL